MMALASWLVESFASKIGSMMSWSVPMALPVILPSGFSKNKKRRNVVARKRKRVIKICWDEYLLFAIDDILVEGIYISFSSSKRVCRGW